MGAAEPRPDPGQEAVDGRPEVAAESPPSRRQVVAKSLPERGPPLRRIRADPSSVRAGGTSGGASGACQRIAAGRSVVMPNPPLRGRAKRARGSRSKEKALLEAYEE